MLSLRKLSPRLFLSNRILIRLHSTATPTRVHIPEKMEIHLTDAENEICTLLDGCTKWMQEQHGTETACRIAGGWVRDKVNTWAHSLSITMLTAACARTPQTAPRPTEQ